MAFVGACMSGGIPNISTSAAPPKDPTQCLLPHLARVSSSEGSGK